MTGTANLKAATIGRLDSLLEAGGLAAKAQAQCQTLLDKLRAPVRIGLFGLPDSGKRRLLNALCDTMVVDPQGAWPTMEVSQGTSAQTHAMLADGSFVQIAGLPQQTLLSQQPAFLRIATPNPALAGRVLLMLASDANADDLRACMAWAAPRVDLILWCSQGWTPFEQKVWHEAPDSLRNHAILVFTDTMNHPPAPEDGFETSFGVGMNRDNLTGFSEFEHHLAAVIDEATTHDIHAAQLFLRHHDSAARPDRARAPGEPEGAAVPDVTPPAVSPSAPPDRAPSHVTRAPCPATSELARLFQTVRQDAESLRQDLADSASEPDSQLIALEQIFERLAERACDLSHLEETWPDLVAQISEARDLALLLRFEGGPAQVTDAARLLLQLREDMEERFAA